MSAHLTGEEPEVAQERLPGPLHQLPPGSSSFKTTLSAEPQITGTTFGALPQFPYFSEHQVPHQNEASD